mmetsp:Transcript_88570/g.255464  ORF Transcript_88570/g.255464 Transcript_88570/m.255464 type:complete len:377 (-) Transcript_88570:46-1176(-)
MIWRSAALACVLTLSSVQAWTTTLTTNTWKTASSTQLEARRAKRGSLGTLASEGLVDPENLKSKQQPQRKKSSNSASKKKNSSTPPTDGSGISPALAQYLASNPDSQVSEEDEPTSPVTSSSSSAASFEVFSDEDDELEPSSKSKNKKKGNARRVKQSQRSQMEEARQQQVQEALDALTAALESNNNLDEILQAVQTLVALPAPTSFSPRQLFQSKHVKNYRLAWVGSDDAICHLGTGLHKVPLARLQEVFFSTKGQSRIEILEIIRILGPFPNVRNTLQGNVKLRNSDDSQMMQIVMDSMIDGTGKEILAGTDDNIRRVDLQLLFSDEQVIVAVVPNTEDNNSPRADPFEKNGSNVLVFLKEDELDEKLESLRVS